MSVFKRRHSHSVLNRSRLVVVVGRQFFVLALGRARLGRCCERADRRVQQVCALVAGAPLELRI